MQLFPDNVRGLDRDPHLAIGAAADDEALVPLTRRACGLHHERETAAVHRDFGQGPWSLIRRWLSFTPVHVHHLPQVSGNNNASRFWCGNYDEFHLIFQG